MPLAGLLQGGRIESRLHVFLLLCHFRSSTRRRFLLQFGLIVLNSSTDEIFQSTFINLITLEKIDRSPQVTFETRVEELVRIWEARPVGKGKLHLVFVGVSDRDYSVMRPHRASHPLPLLDYLPVGLKDALADADERFATPVCKFCDQLVNMFRWIHWILAVHSINNGHWALLERGGDAAARRGFATGSCSRLRS
jgi:hypothetical protein